MCLFVDPPPTLKQPGNCSNSREDRWRSGTNVSPVAMRIAIVTEKITSEDIRHQASLWELSHADRLTILDLRERSRCFDADAVAFEPLRGLILDHLPDTWTAQQKEYRQFSASHLGAFWKLSLQYPLQVLNTTPFDLLAHARRNFAKAYARCGFMATPKVILTGLSRLLTSWTRIPLRLIPPP